jgi:hypothetical protein
LYVDDEPENLTLFRLLFERDFNVLTAAGGARQDLRALAQAA